MSEQRHADPRSHEQHDATTASPSPAPGKRTRSERLQLKASAAPPALVGAPPAGGTGLVPGQSYLDSIVTPVQLQPAGNGGDAGGTGSQPAAQAIAAQGLTATAGPLPHAAEIQASFGRHAVDGIAAHVGGAASDASRALGAHAYAMGNSVAFASAPDLHTAAHEAAHVVQQRAGVHLKDGIGVSGDDHERHADAVADRVVRGESAEALLDQYRGAGGGDAPVQCSFAGSFPIPGATSGFEIDLQTREGGLVTPAPAGAAAKSGMDGSIRFIPGRGAPNANVIAITQIVKLTDVTAADVDPASMPPDRAARGGLGTPGVRTDDDAARGVEGGFFTDVHHRDNVGAAPAAQGSALSPRYHFQPAGAGAPGGHGMTQQPPQYGGGTGGVVGQTPGFKRSDRAEDIRSAAMYDFPGVPGTTWNLSFGFESVARAEDQNIDYGQVKWGFNLRAGHVEGERLEVLAGSSATFGEAMERHRDFYVHEPVTFYFEFDSAALGGAEAAKIDAFVAYMTRNPDVQVSLDGFADQVGGASQHNRELSERRATTVRDAMIARTIPAARITAPVHGSGASTAATTAPSSETPAGTGDQGGDPAVGADQSREANRWANRRVVATFVHVPAAAPAGPAGPAAPAGPAGP